MLALSGGGLNKWGIMALNQLVFVVRFLKYAISLGMLALYTQEHNAMASNQSSFRPGKIFNRFWFNGSKRV